MRNFRFILITTVTSLVGCSSVVFHETGNDEYAMYKVSDACAVGMPSSILDYLRQEANKFCATRKEKVKEISNQTTVGIPIVRCADAMLKFKCESK